MQILKVVLPVAAVDAACYQSNTKGNGTLSRQTSLHYVVNEAVQASIKETISVTDVSTMT